MDGLNAYNLDNLTFLLLLSDFLYPHPTKITLSFF